MEYLSEGAMLSANGARADVERGRIEPPLGKILRACHMLVKTATNK